MNQDFDQSANFGNSVKTALSFKKLGIPQVNEVALTSTATSITATINATAGATSITKYYYSLNDGDYVESTKNSYTFNNLDSSTNYKVSVKVLNSDGNESSVVSNRVDTKEDVLPTVSSITTSKTANTITVNLVTTKGTSDISEYYYSIDNGVTYEKGTTNTYTFSSLTSGTNYNIKAYVVDSKNKQSNVVSSTVKTLISFTIASEPFFAEQGMTWDVWVNSSYNTNNYCMIKEVFSVQAVFCQNTCHSLILNNNGQTASDIVQEKSYALELIC